MRKAAATMCEVIDVEAEDSGREMVKGQASLFLDYNMACSYLKQFFSDPTKL